MATPLNSEWNQLKEKVLDVQEVLIDLFEATMYDGEESTQEFKDGLRFATYLTLLLELKDYPDEMEVGIESLKEILTFFEEAGDTFENVEISTLKELVFQFEDILSGNEGWDVAEYLMVTNSAPDPAEEDDYFWIINLLADN